jgi:hypothetical protein
MNIRKNLNDIVKKAPFGDYLTADIPVKELAVAAAMTAVTVLTPNAEAQPVATTTPGAPAVSVPVATPVKTWKSEDKGRPKPGDLHYSDTLGRSVPIHSVHDVSTSRGDCGEEDVGMAQYALFTLEGELGAGVRYCVKPVKRVGCDDLCASDASIVSWGLAPVYSQKGCAKGMKCVPAEAIPDFPDLEGRVTSLEEAEALLRWDVDFLRDLSFEDGERLDLIEGRIPEDGNGDLALRSDIPTDLVRKEELARYLKRTDVSTAFIPYVEASVGGVSGFDGSYRSPVAGLKAGLAATGRILGIDVAGEVSFEGGPGIPTHVRKDYHSHGEPVSTPSGDVERVHEDTRTRSRWLDTTARVSAGHGRVYAFIEAGAGLMKDEQTARDTMPDGTGKPPRDVTTWKADYTVGGGVGYRGDVLMLELGGERSFGMDQTSGVLRTDVAIPGLEGGYVGADVRVSDDGNVSGRAHVGWRLTK